MIHKSPHPRAGQTVHVDLNGGELAEFQVEDWWDRVSGGSWMTAGGNPAAVNYAFRVRRKGLPFDDEVVYGKIGGFGHLVHVSELGGPA